MAQQDIIWLRLHSPTQSGGRLVLLVHLPNLRVLQPLHGTEESRSFGVKVQGLGSRVQGLGFRVYDASGGAEGSNTEFPST